MCGLYRQEKRYTHVAEGGLAITLMKKDITHVSITFSLVAAMVLGGSFFYGGKVSTELALEKATEEKRAYEQELLSVQAEQQAEEQIKAAKEAEAERIAKEEALAEEKIKIAQAQDQSAKAQEVYQAELKARQAEIDRINAEAIALAEQLATDQAQAKIEAQKLADQKAADAQAKRASRKSRAS
jgi:hypothetical protein